MDPDKPWVWPLYLCALRVRHRRPAVLLVLTLDPAVARWASQPLDLGPGFGLQPVVVGPDQIPWILDPEQARCCPERAVLSVLAHGGSAEAATLGWAAMSGIQLLDEERVKVYSELVWLALNPAARSVLEAMMTRNFELKGELLAILERRYFMERDEQEREEGERQILQRLLARRFGELPAWAVERLQQASRGELERLADAVLGAPSLEEVFEG